MKANFTPVAESINQSAFNIGVSTILPPGRSSIPQGSQLLSKKANQPKKKPDMLSLLPLIQSCSNLISPRGPSSDLLEDFHRKSFMTGKSNKKQSLSISVFKPGQPYPIYKYCAQESNRVKANFASKWTSSVPNIHTSSLAKSQLASSHINVNFGISGTAYDGLDGKSIWNQNKGQRLSMNNLKKAHQIKGLESFAIQSCVDHQSKSIEDLHSGFCPENSDFNSQSNFYDLENFRKTMLKGSQCRGYQNGSSTSNAFHKANNGPNRTAAEGDGFYSDFATKRSEEDYVGITKIDGARGPDINNIADTNLELNAKQRNTIYDLFMKNTQPESQAGNFLQAPV